MNSQTSTETATESVSTGGVPAFKAVGSTEVEIAFRGNEQETISLVARVRDLYRVVEGPVVRGMYSSIWTSVGALRVSRIESGPRRLVAFDARLGSSRVITEMQMHDFLRVLNGVNGDFVPVPERLRQEHLVPRISDTAPVPHATTDQVRRAYAAQIVASTDGAVTEEAARADFDRWLAQHDTARGAGLRED